MPCIPAHNQGLSNLDETIPEVGGTLRGHYNSFHKFFVITAHALRAGLLNRDLSKSIV